MSRLFSKKTFLVALIIAVIAATTAWMVDNQTADNPGANDGRDIVVVVHGLGRSKIAMWLIAARLEEAGFRVARVGYRSLRDTPKEIVEDVEGQISDCCLDKSPKLHFVGHSFGGLVIRAYLSNHEIDNLGRVALIGTPNTGTEIVDNLRHEWWFQVLGPAAHALGTDENSFPNTIGLPNYPLGIIAGKMDNPNDKLLPGDDDGLVSVESTRVVGMTDFVVVETGHSRMRSDEDVAEHIINFLKRGRFNRN